MSGNAATTGGTMILSALLSVGGVVTMTGVVWEKQSKENQINIIMQSDLTEEEKGKLLSLVDIKDFSTLHERVSVMHAECKTKANFIPHQQAAEQFRNAARHCERILRLIEAVQSEPGNKNRLDLLNQQAGPIFVAHMISIRKADALLEAELDNGLKVGTGYYLGLLATGLGLLTAMFTTIKANIELKSVKAKLIPQEIPDSKNA
jgi:hypothetical protein